MSMRLQGHLLHSKCVIFFSWNHLHVFLCWQPRQARNVKAPSTHQITLINSQHGALWEKCKPQKINGFCRSAATSFSLREGNKSRHHYARKHHALIFRARLFSPSPLSKYNCNYHNMIINWGVINRSRYETTLVSNTTKHHYFGTPFMHRGFAL